MQSASSQGVETRKGTRANATTLVHALTQNAIHNPDHVFVKWVDQSCTVVKSLTYEELWFKSGLVVDLLRETGVEVGNRVMIAYPFGLEFLSGLVGCMRLGAIACSVYPPNLMDKSKTNQSFAQFNRQVEDAGATVALTTRQFKAALFVASLRGPKTNGVRWIQTDNIKSNRRNMKPQRASSSSSEIKPEDIAFIQYSSGSTGAPKGVTIRHDAVTRHLRCLSSEIKYETGSVMVTWMPQYHDFALILGFLLSCFTTEGVLVACSPLHFIRNPLLWADMIEKFEATMTAGPNFSYSLLAKRMKAASRTLVAPRLIQASVGAEPIAADTLLKMQEMGIKKSMIVTSYGMAEACLRVSNAFGDEIRVIDGVVSVGYLSRYKGSDTTVQVASERGQILSNGEVGEVYLRGANISLGYWNKPELDHRFKVKLSDGNEYFATGDLGRIIDDHLFVVGRSKELIIINGRNVYPTDIERVVENEYHDIVRPGSSVAFQRSDKDIGVIVEIRKTVGASGESIPKTFTPLAIKRLLSRYFDVDVGLVLALRQGTVPKTTSGKLKRVEARHRCMENCWGENEILFRSISTMEGSSDGLVVPKPPPIETAIDIRQHVPFKSVEMDLNHEDKGDEAKVMRLVQSVLGEDFDDVNMSWEEAGLSSLAQAELSLLLERHMLVKLPFNFNERFKTPAELTEFILAQSGRSFRIELTDLPVDPGQALPKATVVLIQGVLICTLLLMLIVATGASIDVHRRFVYLTEKTSYYMMFGSLPAFLSTFMLSLSLIVIAAKWLVVGKYQEREIQVYSPAYLRWWFIDRLVHLWELWVGQLVVGTPLIWMFYWLLGAKIHPRTKVNAFIREFDLVGIGCDSSIKNPLRCRRFGPWNDRGGPSLRFRQIKIGSGCLVEGIASLGANIADMAHVDKLSVLAEGARVGAKTRAVGNPAFDDGDANTNTGVSSMLLLLQTLWLLVELHIISALFVLSNVMWIGLHHSSWRYSALVYIVTSLLTTSFLSLPLSIMLKWLMIGKRQASDNPQPALSLWVDFSGWACDYHYLSCAKLFRLASGLSRVWNVVLMLHGLDIDLQTGIVEFTCFYPSMVNQLVARRTFFSTFVAFRPGDKIEVIDSSVGYGAILSSGIKVHRSTVRALGNVQESMFDDNHHPMKITVWNMILDEVMSVIFFLILCFSFVPSYELYLMAVSLGDGGFQWVFLGVVLSVAMWFVTWFVLTWIVQAIAIFLRRHKSSFPVLADSWHHVFLQITWFNCRFWGHWFLVWGTPFFNTLARGMGASIEGDLFFNGRTVHDIHALSFQDKTVIDESHLSAHSQIGNNITTEPSSHSGVLNEGCFTLAGSQCDGVHTTEYGPLQPIFGKSRIGGETSV